MKKKFKKKNIYFCFIDYANAIYHVETGKLLKRMGIPDHLTHLWINLYAGQEATDRTGHGETDWFKLRKEYNKATHGDPAYLNSTQITSCKVPG